MQRMKSFIMPLRRTGLLVLLILSTLSESKAITYYSRTSGLWSVNSSWSTLTYGSPINTGTYPKRGDVVFIGDGHNISMNVNSVTASITIGQGTSGSLMYSNYLTFLMVVAGNITVNNGATFGYASNSSKMHSLFISGSIINNGAVDLYYDANDYVNVTFNSTVHSIISGSGSWDLNKITLFKSTLTSYKLEVTAPAFEVATRELVVSYGTFVHNNTSSYNVNPSFGDMTVFSDAVFQVMDGRLTLAPSANYVYLQGQLKVTGGTLQIGSGAGLQGIRYDQSGVSIPAIDITGGTLKVNGGITYRTGNASDPVRFNQSGGSVLLNCGTTGTNLEVFNIDNAASSRFTMSGGSITLQKPNSTGSTVSDFNICGSSGTVTSSAGNIIFGNSSTSSGVTFNFTPYANAIQPHFRVSGPAAGTVTLRPSNNSTSNFKLLSLNIEANKIFDIRSIAGSTGDSRTMSLSDNFDAVHAFYNDGTFTPRTGTVVLQGAEGLWIGGSAATTFYNITINNPLGVSLSKTINISHTLLLLDGVLYSTTTNLIICNAGASSNIGSSISYVDGPMRQLVASTSAQSINFPIGKSGAYRPVILAVQHSTLSSVPYTSEVINVSARAMSFSLPPSLGWVSDVRYYDIKRSNTPNLSNARITLSYGADDWVTDFNNLRVARDNGSSAWLDLGGVGTANGSGSITSANFNGFNNYFTLANATGGINPLPVEFIQFSGKAGKTNVVLDWSTASEVNSDYFDVERSADGKTYLPIGRVGAKGFSNQNVEYNYLDMQPLKGQAYYRLRQVDRDGSFDYSKIVSVNYKKSSLDLYPNPVTNGLVSFNIPAGDREFVEVRLFDLTGKQVMLKHDISLNGTTSQLQLPPEINPGTYFLQLTSHAGEIWKEKLVVTF